MDANNSVDISIELHTNPAQLRWTEAVNLVAMTSCCCGSGYRSSKGKKLKESPRKSRHLHNSSNQIQETTSEETVSQNNQGMDAPRKNGFSEKEHIELREAFDMFDTNSDGKISCTELATVIRVLRFDISDNDVHEMIKVVDSNENGVVDYDEYLSLMRRFSSQKSPNSSAASHDSDERTVEAFRVFDLDGNGYIDRDELRTVMRRLGENISEEDVRAMFREADLNADGKIDYSEFSQVLLQLT